MSGAVGVLEVAAVAKGVLVADICLKTAKVELLSAQAVCPGKYMIIIGGEVSAVKEAVQASLKAVEEIADSVIMGNIHDQVFAAIAGQTPIKNEGALGIIELYSVPAGIMSADIAVKAAQVHLVDLQLARGMAGKAVLYLRGEIGAVQVAVENVEKQMGSTGLLGSTAVIAAPHQDLWNHIW